MRRRRDRHSSLARSSISPLPRRLAFLAEEAGGKARQVKASELLLVLHSERDVALSECDRADVRRLRGAGQKMSSPDHRTELIDRQALPDDALECARIVVEAYAPLRSTELMFPNELDSRATLIEARRKQFAQQLGAPDDGGGGASLASRHQSAQTDVARWPKQYTLACDASTGQAVALLRWTIVDVPENESRSPPIIRQAVASKLEALGPARLNDQLFGVFLEATSNAHIDLYAGKGPHGILMTLATIPAQQRKGAGALLMSRFVEALDAQRMPGYLEATLEGKRLYDRFGFREVDRLDINHDGKGFPIWLMTRPAKQNDI